MGPQILAYPFLFIAIFFETFVLLTFLSTPARRARARGASAKTPTVAIIIPCYNEMHTVAGTVKSALALDYPTDKLEVVLVDDGSTDGTPAAMAAFADNPQVKIIRKENGGKHTALNAGIAATSAELVGCLDADSFVESSALREVISCFDTPEVAATTAAMSVHEPQNLLQHMQNAEYIFGILLRHSLSTVNGLYVTPGPFSFYRREIVERLGGFRKGHQTEDLEMALRIQRAGYAIDNAPRARVYTKAPTSVPKLIKQRTRWTTGFLRNVLNEYRDLIGNRKYGTLGTMVLPIGISAIGSGIVLFLLSLSLLTYHIGHAIFVHMGIPYTFSFGHIAFDWFYIPLSFYIVLAIFTILTTLVMIAIGKRVSATPGSLSRGILAYALLYGFIAPFWLMRATADVVTGARRAWK
ncbi:MAG TPA: glycosyltransferase [Candidatus Paceibacterota bacterium]|nr:glycosyltransferase [Candidatus Paceibacterota bacterium]